MDPASYTALLSPKQRLFVLAIVKGATYSEAYKKAGFKSNVPATIHSNASKVLQIPKVKAAIEGARLAAAQRAEITVDTIIERLERAYEVALTVDPPQTSAAVAAAMGQAKVLGLVIDRSQVDVVHHKPAPFPTKTLELSQAEWLAQFDQKKALPGPKKKIT
jgi:phage terminase small subunit